MIPFGAFASYVDNLVAGTADGSEVLRHLIRRFGGSPADAKTVLAVDAAHYSTSPWVDIH